MLIFFMHPFNEYIIYHHNYGYRVALISQNRNVKISGPCSTKQIWLTERLYCPKITLQFEFVSPP